MVSDGNGTLYLTYTRWPNSCCDEDADVIVKLSFDGGNGWSTPMVLDSGPFVGAGVIAAQPTGTAVVVWSRPLAAGPGPADVMSRSTFDRGVTWSPAIRLNETSGSVLNFDGRRDPTPQVASDPQGRIYATWIESASNTVVRRSDDGGLTWSPPVVVNDVPQGFRWQPTVAVGTDGVVHSTWYDRRTGNVNVVYASSSDGGQTWSENVRVTTMETPATMDGRSTRLGDYMGLAALPDGTAYAVWTDRRNGDQDIFGARIP